MKVKQPVVYFNNCRNREHVKLFGSSAFFDLLTVGKQGTQARNLNPGQPCVVVKWAPTQQLVFDWYSFHYETILLDERDVPDRVFFGRWFASETLPKAIAAKSKRYGALFRNTGHLKIGSVFHRELLPGLIPSGNVGKVSRGQPEDAGDNAGAGFGDPAENKLVEAAAIRFVTSGYEGANWSVKSVEREKCGYDLECTKGGVVEHIEVKGVSGGEPCFIITAGEVKQARTNAKFMLAIVTSALSASPKLLKFTGSEFVRRFTLAPIQYRAALV